MNKVPQLVAISEMKVNQPNVLAKLNAGPVVLANRSKPAAVLVSVEQWDGLMDRLEELETRRRDELAAGRALSEQEWAIVKQGRAALARRGATISNEELKAKLKERYPDVADKI